MKYPLRESRVTVPMKLGNASGGIGPSQSNKRKLTIIKSHKVRVRLREASLKKKGGVADL